MSYKYTINIEEKKATLDLLVGGVFETSYSYNNGNVTLSERPNSAVLQSGNFRTNLEYIKKWIGLINTEFSPSQISREKFEEKVDRDQNKVTAKFKHINTTVTTAKYDFNDKVYDFDPRPEVTMNFTCFKAWYDFLDKFYWAAL